MTDSLKFGPEWLRNLSQDGPSAGSGGGGPKYQLAEHRYGREEMLALFDKTLGQPELLGKFKSLYVERLQPPLALAPTQEDEANLTNRGGWPSRPLTGGGSSSIRGGRGGGVSVDRGRGRGVRGNAYHSQNMMGGSGVPQLGSSSYPRSQSGFDPDDVGIRIGRPRPWAEQNGEAEWNGTTSPRKEFNPTGRANTDNWRRHRGTDDDDGWRNQPEQRRTEKWGRGGGTSSSWRDGDTSGGGQEGGPGGDRELLSRGIERLERELRERGSGGSASDRGDRITHNSQSSGASAVARSWNARKPWDVDDILPEWAMENPSESGGTFDASGAFHGSDDENERSSRLNHSHSTNNIHSSPRPATLSRSQTQGSILINKHSNSSNNQDTSNSKHRLKDHSATETSHSDEEMGYQNRRSEDTRQSNSARKIKPEREISIEHLEPDQKSPDTPNQNNKILEGNNKTDSKKQQDNNSKNKPSAETPIKKNGSPKKSIKIKDDSEQVQKMNDSNNTSRSNNDGYVDERSSESPVDKKDEYSKTANCTQEEEDIIKRPDIPRQSQPQHDEFARMQEVADDLVAHLMMDDERAPPAMTTVQQQIIQQSLPVSSMVAPPMTLPPNLHGVMPLLPPTQPVVMSVVGSDKWFYRDPQGEVQGPFLASEMSEWYRAGYFTNELLVRRACDDRYTTLGELVKVCGGVVPFNPSVRLPPLKVETSVLNSNGLQSPLTTQQTNPALIPGTPQYRQAQLLGRQIAARQEAHLQVLRDLSRSERWASMTPGEQNAVLMQQLAQIPFPDAFATPNVPAGLGIVPPSIPLTQPTTVPQHNPLLQLISQMQQTKQTGNLISQVPPLLDPTKPSALGHIVAGFPMPSAMNHLNNLSSNHITASTLHHQLAKKGFKSEHSTAHQYPGVSAQSDFRSA
ncbi:GIGYF family protein CG11148-like [Ctenocephalides felis]|uniref:GIGYF family protein CG11148-like n=1 Tax=Ctenocephalides felis TaxID=7515 RepID=UPI000E6E337A|nr:GIGYF family protein CG11148-like [Ctenocephalides felis]